MKTVTRWLAGICLASVALAAQAVRITPAHSGSWYDPQYDKQGFAFEVLDKVGPGPEHPVLVYWYTYDDDGNPVWAVGMGDTEGNVVHMTMNRPFGGARPPEQVTVTDVKPWADMVFTFGNCHTGTAEFTMTETGQTGTYNLVRLTHIGATTCTGGMSDTVPPGAEPVTLVAQMSNTAGFPDAQGKVTYKLRPGYAELEIDVQKVPAGTYTALVGGVSRGDFLVTITGNGNGIGKGTLTFKSPSEPGSPLLDFEPRGALVEVANDSGAVALTATLPGP